MALTSHTDLEAALRDYSGRTRELVSFPAQFIYADEVVEWLCPVGVYAAEWTDGMLLVTNERFLLSVVSKPVITFETCARDGGLSLRQMLGSRLGRGDTVTFSPEPLSVSALTLGPKTFAQLQGLVGT